MSEDLKKVFTENQKLCLDQQKQIDQLTKERNQWREQALKLREALIDAFDTLQYGRCRDAVVAPSIEAFDQFVKEQERV